jgi:hypothetical protein
MFGHGAGPGPGPGVQATRPQDPSQTRKLTRKGRIDAAGDSLKGAARRGSRWPPPGRAPLLRARCYGPVAKLLRSPGPGGARLAWQPGLTGPPWIMVPPTGTGPRLRARCYGPAATGPLLRARGKTSESWPARRARPTAVQMDIFLELAHAEYTDSACACSEVLESERRLE